MQKGHIEIFKSDDGVEVMVKVEKDSVWLDSHMIATLFDVNRPAIVKYIYKTSTNVENWTIHQPVLKWNRLMLMAGYGK